MNLQDYKKDFDAVLDFLKQDISGLRTGRASTAMVEDISIEAYGSRQPLKNCASIVVADAKTLNIEPWDKSILASLEKGIRDSSLGINPVNDGRLLRLILPDLTTERRKELAKVLGQKLEQARISIRKVREEIKQTIVAAEKEKKIAEDDKYGLQEELDKMVKEYNAKIEEIGKNKEEEIMKV